MKKIATTFFALLFYLSSQAQTDTVPVIMIVSDTCMKWVDSSFDGKEIQRGYINKVFWMKGFIVRDRVGRRPSDAGFFIDQRGGLSLPYYYDFLCYLDERKKKLSDCNFVWKLELITNQKQ